MERLPEPDDRTLIKRFLAGDRDALDELLRRYRGEAVRIALSVLHNEDDAFDAAQEAFIKVFRNIHKFGGRSRFSTWLYRIVYNAALDVARKKRRYVNRTEGKGEDQRAGNPGDRGEYAPPDDRLARSEKEELVRRCLDELPFKYRVVITLKDIEGLSYDEIAEMLSTSRGNVMSRLYYGRSRLRKMIEARMRR